MNIVVKHLTGKTMDYHVQSTDTVQSVKEKVLHDCGFAIEQQNLIYAGKRLENSRTLADYNVQDKATFYVVLHVKGGR